MPHLEVYNQSVLSSTSIDFSSSYCPRWNAPELIMHCIIILLIKLYGNGGWGQLSLLNFNLQKTEPKMIKPLENVAYSSHVVSNLPRFKDLSG